MTSRSVKNYSVPSVSRNMPEALPARSPSRPNVRAASLCHLGWTKTNRRCDAPSAVRSARQKQESRSLRPPSGCRTIIISSRARSAKSGQIYRRAIIASFRSWSRARLLASLASSDWLGPMSPTQTATSTPSCSAATSVRIRRSSPSQSANSGR